MQLPEPYFTRGLKPAVFIFALVPLATHQTQAPLSVNLDRVRH